MYYGDSFADLATMRLEGKIKNIYAQAYREIEEKLNTFLAKSVIKEKEYEAKVQAGKLSQEWFDRWKSGQVFIGKRWRDLRQNISEEIYNSRKSATDMINDERKAVFQDNVNYAQYTIDKDHSFGISFTLYDNATVTRLIKEDPDLVPDVKYPDPQIDYAWSKKQITSAITQGILQGESIPELAKRVGKKLQSSNTASMVRCARTAMTGAQNSGRIQAMHNAQDMGIQVQKVWIATLDDRTRDSHRDLDGQTIGVDEPFHSLYGEIMYPADPNAAPADTWNCRCSLGYNYPKYSNQYDTRAARDADWEEGGQTEQIPYMTYKEWAKWKKTGQLPQRGLANTSSQNNQAENELQQISENIRNVVQGKDISETWTRRPDEFDFEIEDVINAQGFDGLPRVVGSKEFDELVKQANGGEGFIAQRIYSAQDKETANAYRKMLYNGKWYVDCSVGTAAYGQGMYSSADFDGHLSKATKDSMSFYRLINAERGDSVSIIETFTLAPNARIANYDKIYEEFLTYKAENQRLLHEENRKLEKKAQDDLLHQIVTKNPSLKEHEDSAVYFIKSQLGMIESDWDKMSEAASLLGKEGRTSATKVASEFNETKNEYTQRYIEENSRTSTVTDIGAYAAMKGYDAIRVNRGVNDSNECVVLNRTKVIFRRPDND